MYLQGRGWEEGEGGGGGAGGGGQPCSSFGAQLKIMMACPRNNGSRMLEGRDLGLLSQPWRGTEHK